MTLRSPRYFLRAFIALLRETGPRAALQRVLEYVTVQARRFGPRRLRRFLPAPRPFTQPWTRVADTPNAALVDGPRISLVMPVFNTPPDVLDQAIRSVVRQVYRNWELCICDDASSDPDCLAVLEDWRGFDPRLKITRSEGNLGISGATNAAAAFGSGEFIGFLDHDDVLTEDALVRFAEAIARNPSADVLYSDEDKLERDETLSEPFFKPDWSPEHLYSSPYILHLMLVRSELFFRLGGLDDTFSGAQDYDLSLRATAAARKVVHVPGVTYHWRKIPGSAAEVVDAKPQALERGRLAVEAFARSQDPGAVVTPGLFMGSFRVRWSLDLSEPVTLLILTGCKRRVVPGRGELLLVENAVDSILAKSTYPNIRIILLNDGDMPDKVRQKFAVCGVRVIDHQPTVPFNYSAKLNLGVSYVETENVIFLNDDIEVISPDWIEALLEPGRRVGVGVVGARLLYPDRRLQHAGIVLGLGGPTGRAFHNLPSDQIHYCCYTHVIRNYSAVTGAAMATRTSLFREVGGYDESLSLDFNDVDFCLRLGERGHRCVWTPYATLFHFEDSSLVRALASEEDRQLFEERWGDRLNDDPYYNIHLPRHRSDFGVERW